MRLAFLLPRIELAGGIFIVLEHARGLARRHDHDVTIVTTEDKVISHAYPSLSDLTCIGIDEAAGQEFDLAVATWWHTVYSLPRLVAPRYAQFAQNLEDRFYRSPEVAARSGAAAVQTLPLAFITTAGWLEQQLRSLRPDAPVYCVRSGIDKEVFRPTNPAPITGDGPLRIAIEGPPDVWFKGVTEALSAVRRMREPRHLVVIVGDRTPTDEMRALADRVEGRLSHTQMADVYANVDVLLKLSRLEGMAGPPLEAFHCGATAVMTPVTGYDEYGEHSVNCMIVGYDDLVGTARTLDLLARDRSFLSQLRANALATARQWPDWRQATTALDAVIADITESPPAADAGYTRQLILESYSGYLRQWMLEERSIENIRQLGVLGQLLWVRRQEGLKGIAARVARRSMTGLRRVTSRFSRDPRAPTMVKHKYETDPGADNGEDADVATDASSEQLEPLDDESREIFLYEYMPRHGDIVVDAGAGHGTEVVTFSRLVGPSGKVVAVEAHPDSFNALRELCERHGLENVELVHAALASEPGVIQISDLEQPVLNSTVGDVRNGIRVTAKTLDEVLGELGIREIGFLKMNIEGAEVDALQGFTQGIRRTQHVCIGCHDFLADGRPGGEEMRTKESVRKFLESAGFSVTSQSHELPWIADYLYGARSSE